MCDLAWFTDMLDSNGAERRKRAHIVSYAERIGGITEEYLRLLFPRYWGMVEEVPAGTEGESLGLTPAEESQILTELFASVLPILKSSPERSGGRQQIKFPATVRHLS